MKTYLVVYCPLGQYTLGLGKYRNKEVFRCQADNNLHAREQCHDAYPGCNVLSVDCETAAEKRERFWTDYIYGGRE